jgi:GntR family transcriptional repressor for pyruvate dehydrogenase complex
MDFIQDISNGPLSKVIMHHIKDAILTGKIKFEEKIPPERELAEGFNVSRNMVREAIRGLEMAGYLEIRQGPKGGAFVRKFTPDRLSTGFLDFYMAERLTIEELNNVRLHIEPEVARLAAKNINPDYALRLQNAIADEHMAEAIDDRVTSLTKVHLILAEMCENFFYEIMVNALLSIAKEITIAGYRKGDAIIHGTGQHIQIVKAVIRGETEKAAKTMHDHLKKFSDGFIELDKKYRQRIRRLI